MKLGIFLPLELREPSELNDFVQACEELGFDHINFGDHVVGSSPAKRAGPYSHKTIFHEPMVTMAFAANATRKIGLVVGVIILPQRQAALVAKQAAQLDFLSGGRLRLGVGVGWNAIEYEALGMDFANRGSRIDEQIEVMRKLWCNELVTFHGKWHEINEAGINPLPVQRPIPIWFGGFSDPMIRRIARFGDGWLMYCDLETQAKTCLEKLHKHCDEIGRDPSEIGIQGWVIVNKSDVLGGEVQKSDAHILRSPEEWVREIRAWKALGATSLDCWTTWGKLTTVDQHIALAKQFKEVFDAEI